MSAAPIMTISQHNSDGKGKKILTLIRILEDDHNGVNSAAVGARDGA